MGVRAAPSPPGEALAPLVATLPLELRPKMEGFLRDCFNVGGGAVFWEGVSHWLQSGGPALCALVQCRRQQSNTRTPRCLRTWTAACWR